MKTENFIELISNLDKNNYYDSGCTVRGNDDIKKAIVTLDIDSGSILYASENYFDTIIVHHAVGKHYYQASKEVLRRAIFLFNNGILTPEQYSPETDSQIICEAMWSSNKISVCSLAERMGVNIISCHSIADEMVAQKIQQLFSETDSIEVFISKLSMLLKTDSVYELYGINPHIYGKCTGNFRKGYCDISYAVPPSDFLIQSVIDNGYDLLILTAVSQKMIQYAKNRGATIICVNHLQTDICAMTLFSNVISQIAPSLELMTMW